jgi:hypothetical protein
MVSLIIDEAGLREEDVRRLSKVVEAREDAKSVSLPEIINFERDAAAVSMEVFRGARTRQRYLGASPVSSDAPFIRALERSGAEILEDRMIDHDFSSFPGAKAIARHMVGAARIRTQSGTLTIVNANRTGIESTLGVDLVYFHDVFNSFTMVQYKRLPVRRASVSTNFRCILWLNQG